MTKAGPQRDTEKMRLEPPCDGGVAAHSYKVCVRQCADSRRKVLGVQFQERDTLQS